MAKIPHRFTRISQDQPATPKKYPAGRCGEDSPYDHHSLVVTWGANLHAPCQEVYGFRPLLSTLDLGRWLRRERRGLRRWLRSATCGKLRVWSQAENRRYRRMIFGTWTCWFLGSMVVSQTMGNIRTPTHDWVDGGFFSFHRFSMIFPKKSLRGPGSAHANWRLSDCHSFPPQDPLCCVTTSGEQQPHGCSGDRFTQKVTFSGGKSWNPSKMIKMGLKSGLAVWIYRVC